MGESLTDFNDLCNLHGLKVVREIIDEAVLASAEWPEPDPLETAEPEHSENYPVDAIPEVLRAAAEEAARFIKVDQLSPATVGLAVAALAIGKKARIEERPGLYHHPALFFSIVASSGERKSPVFRTMTRPLEEWIASRQEPHRQELARVKAEQTVIDGLVTALKRKASDTKLDEAEREVYISRISSEEAKRPPTPPPPRMFTSDATEERLFQKLHEHAGAYGVLSGEGRPIFDTILGRYSNQGRTGDGIYLAAISGDTITRDRVGGEAGPEERAVVNPCLTVCVMVQPDKYFELARHPSLRESGALARIWPVMPRSRVGTRLELPGEGGLNELKLQPYHDTILMFMNTPPPRDPLTGEPLPHLATLGPEAAEARRAWHNTVEQLMATGQELADVRDLASKAVSATCKLALVLHLVQNPALLKAHRSEISLSTWRNAQLLGEFYLGEAIRIQRGSGEDAITAAARRIVRWAVESGRKEFSTAEVQQYGPRPRLEKKHLAPVAQEMVERGWIRPTPGDGVERAVRYQLNPGLFSQFSQFSRGRG